MCSFHCFDIRKKVKILTYFFNSLIEYRITAIRCAAMEIYVRRAYRAYELADVSFEQKRDNNCPSIIFFR